MEFGRFSMEFVVLKKKILPSLTVTQNFPSPMKSELIANMLRSTFELTNNFRLCKLP